MTGASENKPPKMACRLLRILVRSGDRQYLLGDLEEYYNKILEERGKSAAYLWYWYQTLIPIPDFIITHVIWSFLMFGNYIKIALRNMKKQLGYTLINITSLALGMSCCLLIALYIHDDLTFDRFHKNLDRIYGIYASIDFGQGVALTEVNSSIAESLEEQFPEITCTVRMNNMNTLFKDGNEFFEQQGLAVDPSFFSIFTVDLISGSRKEFTKNPNSVILNRFSAEKYFSHENPVGKTVTIKFDGQFREFTVTGISSDIPDNSSISFDFLLNYRGVFKDDRNMEGHAVPTFLLLGEGKVAETLETKFRESIDRNLHAEFNEKSGFKLFPFSDYHLNGEKTSPALARKSVSVKAILLKIR